MKLGKLLIASAAVFAMGVMASAANAVTVSIGFQQAGVNGGGITSVASGTDAAAYFGGYGSFTNSSFVGGSSGASTVFGSLLGSTSANVSSDVAGTLTVYITAQGLTAPAGNVSFTSVLTSNTLPAGWTVTESTLLSTTNDLFTGTTLASHTFAATNTFTSINGGVTSALYSVTQVYTIVATGAGSAFSTISISAVPGPMVGAGLPGLVAACCGLLALSRRRRKAAI